jgi:RNA polymerase sigma factor (sigma-70 family)
LDEDLVQAQSRNQDLVRLDDALHDLAVLDERKSRIVEMRFFAGLSVEEIAAVLNLSTRTVIRDWEFARAWLQRQIRSES